MTEAVMEQQAEVRFSADDQLKVERIKKLLVQEKQTAWEIGDLVLAVCGPSGTPEGMGRLRALAAELNVSDQLLARYRITSQVFPRHKRVYDLPHSAYQFTQAYADVADEILSRVAQEPRAYSATFLGEVKDEVLREAGKLSRTPARLTMPERFINSINTFRERVRKNQFSVGRSEALAILEAWEAAEPYIRAAARGGKNAILRLPGQE